MVPQTGEEVRWRSKNPNRIVSKAQAGPEPDPPLEERFRVKIFIAGSFYRVQTTSVNLV